MALPGVISYCKITGLFLEATADTSGDPDDLPQGNPLAGATVTFRAAPSAIRTSSPAATTIPREFVCSTDASGYLYSPGVTVGEDGNAPADKRCLYILASDDPDIEPHDWPWYFKVYRDDLPSISGSFIATADGEIDLATVVQVPASPGAETAAWIAAVSAAQSARDAAQSARDLAVEAAAHPSDPAVAALIDDPDSEVRASLSSTYVAARTAALLSLSRSPASEAVLTRVSASKYQLAYRLGGQEYARWDLLSMTTNPGGLALHQLHQSAIDMPWLSVDEGGAGVAFTGAGWASATTQAAAYGGTYRHNPTGAAGDFVTFTPATGASRVGIRACVAINCGIALVEVDGDKTRANRLPTAQALVDLGRLASSALIAGGGTLNPTDRVLDTHPLASSPETTVDYDRHFAIADGLDPAVSHTVKITITAYKNAASSGTRLYVGGFTHATPTTTLDTAGTALLPVRRLLTQMGSAYEYAHQITASGTAAFIGNIHGYDTQTALTVYQDGGVVVMTDGQILRGQAFELVRESALRHPSTGATNLALVTTNYRLTSDGLWVTHSTTWQGTYTVNRSYPAMLPVDGFTFTVGSLDAAPVDYALTANAGAYQGQIKAATGYVWEPAGQLGALMHLPNPEQSTAAWAESAGMFAAIEDRTPTSVNAGNLSKIYVARVGPESAGVAVAAGQVWKSTALYRVMRAVNIDATLAR